jgi:peptide/nickel transport system permease protein
MRTLRALSRDRRFTIGAIVLLGLGGLAVLSFFSPFDPTEWYVVPRDMRPSLQYFLGTDSKGQDVFWQMTSAVLNSLVVAIAASFISRVIAVTIGLVAGYKGGNTDRVLMFISDGFMVIPLFLILVLLAMLLRTQMNLTTMAILLGVVGWPWDCRLVRSQILSLREREFTYTAILAGAPARKLIFRQYMPFVIPLVLATFLNHTAFVVGMEMTLALIGLTDATIPTLGSILKWAVDYQAPLLGLWWWILAPVGIAIALFVALYLVFISISAYLNPRARIQRVGSR